MLGRIPRSSLFYFFLVVALGIVFYFTWQSIESGNKAGEWTYTQLKVNADEGKVKSLESKGTDATATTKDGAKYDVHLPDNTDQLARDMAAENPPVDVKYTP